MQILVRFRAFGIGAFVAGTLFAAAAMADTYSKVTTFAGDPGTNNTILKEPAGVIALPTGDLLVSDSGNHRIVHVTASGAVRPVVGSGKSGSQDGGPAVAEFKEPRDLVLFGDVTYVADTGNDRIRKITVAGVVSTLAVSGLKRPSGLAVDAAGNLYVADSGHDVIRKITPAGVMTIVAGVPSESDPDRNNQYTDGPALQATFDEPRGLAISAGGVLYIVDSKNDAIRKLENGVVTTVAGGTRSGFLDGPALNAQFDRPTGIALDDAGNLLIADTKNERIRKVTLSATPAVSTIAGTGASGLVDGVPSSARFKGPAGIAYAGAVFVADAQNQVIRAIYQTVTVASVTPSKGASGTQVRVRGTGFVNAQTTVAFNTTAATAITFVSSTELLVTVPALGPGRYDLTVTTPGGAATLPAAFTIQANDTDLPVITAAVAPLPNAAGWNNTAVRVTFTCADATSGIATCTAPVDVVADTAAQIVTGTAVDNAGNQNSVAVTIRIDKGAPAITSTVTPAPNARGWTNADTTVRFDATDALSGIASVSPPATVATEMAGQQVAGRATDVAGNAAETFVTVKLDKTAPAATATATPAPNAAGWNNSNVTVTFAGTDALSGVFATDPPKTVSAEGTQTVTGNVTDAAGNNAQASAPVKIDKTQPTITAALAPAPNAAGWNNSNVTVTFNASDALSGIASTTAPVVVSTEGASVAASGTATDNAGNSVAGSATVKLDKTQPLLTLDPVVGPTTVYSPQVTLSGTASDALSGLTSITCNGTPATRTGNTFQCTVTLPRGAHDVAVIATDAAGNAATATQAYTLADDTKAPLIFATVADSLAEGWAQRVVNVFFECADGETGIASCPPPVVVRNEGAGQVVSGTAVDKAGNSAQASISVSIDSTAPLLSIDAPPAAPINASRLTVAGSASDALSGLTKLTCNGLEAAMSGARFTCDVALFPGVNDVVVEAGDRARNELRSTITVHVDTMPPTLEIGTPAPGSTTGGETVTITGTVFDDDQIAAVTVNGIAAEVTGESFTASVPISGGSNTLTVNATDRAGNRSTAAVDVTRFAVPLISISEPADLLVTADPTIDIRGTVTGAATVSVDGIPASISGNTFHAAGIPLAQGRTVITALATAPGGPAATTSVNIYRDSIPPRVVLRSPADGAVVTQSPVTVTGMVDDIVVGTINAGQVSVTVNGVTAQVMNRSFIATGVTLSPGQNTLLITAVDQGRNTATATARVTYTAAPSTNRLTIVSGDAQQAAIGARLPIPLVVRLTDGTGSPLSGRPVVFRIAENNGTLEAGDQNGRQVTATTDADGRAQVAWTLGMRAGAGNQRVAVTASGAAAAEIVATGTFGAPHLIVVDAGNGQISALAAELPRPLVAVVVDAGSNRLANVPVTFSVLNGGGNFSGQPSITVNTDSDGRAIVRPALGPDPGRDNNAFAATAPGVGAPSAFFATGLIPGNSADTRISGVVLDNTDIPIPGVSIRIEGTALMTQSDSQGYFNLTNVPVGYVKLFVDGSTATRPGSWPMLEYAMYTVPGADNTLGMPVYLLPIDTARGIAVSETIGGTLTLPELPGFSLSIAPGAATFPGGARTGTVSVTLVHADKMPMPPGFGQQPRFIVTIQPPGVHFDPPAAMTLPNVEGLAPGEVTEMYSFDHDLGQFVAIGTASASEDGSVIRSDPGVGIIKGGWHCGGNPSSSGTSANCGYCGMCQGTNCVPNPARAGQPCPSDGIACTEDICRDGHCRHIPITIRIGGITTATRNIYVSRDDPSRTLNDQQNLPNGQALYSNDTAGDLVAWRAHIDNVSMRSRVTSYEWKATGPETHTGPASSEWMVGNLNWKPGTYTITLKVNFNNGCSKTATYTQRVGIRTNDYILYGSILAFPPPTAGVGPITLFRWTCTNIAFIPSLLLAAHTPIDFNNILSGLYTPEEWPSRLYANYQLLNATANDPPNPTRPDRPLQNIPIVLPSDGGPPVEIPVHYVAGVSPLTGYRQAVRAQFRYLVTDDGKIVWPPTPIGPVFSIDGMTTPPCEPTNTIPGPYGELGPRNGKLEPYPDGTGFGYIMQIRAGTDGQDGYRKLNRRFLPYVYFRMRFHATDGKLHSRLIQSSNSPDGPDEFDYCPMPTYFLFERVWLDNPGEYGMAIQPGFPIYQNLEKFLAISVKDTSTGGPYYPPD